MASSDAPSHSGRYDCLSVAQRDEFRGNVAFVGTRDFYRPKEQSPSGQAYHWNSNAETYYLIGDGMGKAMLRLLKAKD